MEWHLCSPSALTGLGSDYYLFRCGFHLEKKHSLLFSYTALPQTFLLIGCPLVSLPFIYQLISHSCWSRPLAIPKHTLNIPIPLPLLMLCMSKERVLARMPSPLISSEPTFRSCLLHQVFSEPFNHKSCLTFHWAFFPRPCNDLFRFPENNS